jgi:hypothetical protein
MQLSKNHREQKLRHRYKLPPDKQAYYVSAQQIGSLRLAIGIPTVQATGAWLMEPNIPISKRKERQPGGEVQSAGTRALDRKSIEALNDFVCRSLNRNAIT